MDFLNNIFNQDCFEGIKNLPDNSIDCCITSPPYYGLRDYGHDAQIGLEKTPEEFVAKLLTLFTEVKRVLKPEGTLWLNMGDSFASGKSRYSTKPNTLESKENGAAKYGKTMKGERPDFYYHPFIKDKDLIGVPWMLAFALRNSGWYLRMDIIWNKPNPMPESVQDRPTKSHEYIFLMSKSAKYYYDADAIKTEMNCNEHDKRSRKGRKRFPTELINGIRGNTPDKIYEWANKRSVWTVNTKPYAKAHFATFPELLIEDCVKAGCPKDGIILDPFMGAGTTALVALKLGRKFTGFEVNEEYLSIANERLHDEIGLFLKTS